MLATVRAVFECQELLDAIFVQLSTGMIHHNETPEDVKDRIELRRTLSNASRVCRAFADVALTKLWCALDNLIPLLRLLPNLEKNESTFVISGEITSEVWTRFRVYASRVRGLCLYPDSGDPVHLSVWHALALQCRGSPMLPNLRVLDVDQIPHSDIVSLSLVLGPSLRELYLSFNSVPTPMDAQDTQLILPSLSGLLLETISTISPDLTIFYVDTHFPAPSRSLHVLKRLSRLKELKLCDPEATVDTPALRAISTLQSLRVLFLEDVHLADSTGDLNLEDGLQLIETFYIHASPPDLLRVVRASGFTALKNLDIMVHCAGGADPLRPLSAMVALLPQTVQIFRLGFCDGTSACPPHLPLGDVLQTLRALRGVTDIAMDTGAQKLSVADNDVKLLADIWPRLRRFLLADDEDRPPRPLSEPHPTLAGLAELARRCPDFESLALPCLDTSVLPRREDMPAAHHALRWLSFEYVVGDTPPLDVAEAIHRLFPNLTLEDALEGAVKQREGTKAWLPIRDKLRALQNSQRG